MKNVLALTKRNCLLFLRSKATVFSSLFSSLILIVLYFLFIAKLYGQGFNEAAGLNLTSKQINFAIYSQMIMGVIVINSVSLTTGMLSFLARDLETRKTDAFLLTKTKSFELVLSYLFSAIIVSFAINFLTLVISIIVIGASTFWIGAGTFFAIVGVLMLTTLISCAMMLLITVLVKSSVAIGVINGFMGTILGFLCGIYMPYENLGTAAKYIGSFLPFTHLTIWLKRIILGDVFGQFGMPANVAETMKEVWFSAGNVGLCGLKIPLWGMIILCIAVALICLIVAALLIRRRLSSGDMKKKIFFRKNKSSKI